MLDDDGVVARRVCSTTALPELGALDRTGLAALRCSGSAQPSVAGFHDLVQRLGVRDADLLVVDLRQESHGFLNGAAISWYAETNWGAAGLPDAEALALEAARLATLARAPTVRISDAAALKRGEPPVVSVWQRHSVADEARAFARPAGRYLRLPVTDHARPDDATVDRFVALVRRLTDEIHLHLHCRGGKGRTATFLCLYDMLRNAARLPRATIFARQARFADYDLGKPVDPARAKAPYLVERRGFLEQFYDYARANPGGAPLGWTAWRAGRPDER